LFRELPRVRSRVVLWGSEAQPVTLPHSGIVVSEEMLLDALRPEFRESDFTLEPGWTIFASRPLPNGCLQQRFGSRMARASEVTLNSKTPPGCWIESMASGWLFLIGSGNDAGWLLAVGGADPGQSRLIAKQIQHASAPAGEFSAFPRIIAPLSGRNADGGGWLACGTAAIAFDPLCGDGTAHAVREAILAAAVIRAIYAGACADEVLAHYESRLTAGFQRHLVNCLDFYRSGGDDQWWREEGDSIIRGLSWCEARMSEFPGFRFRLNGYELEAAAAG
jgi:hypothetical protein